MAQGKSQLNLKEIYALGTKIIAKQTNGRILISWALLRFMQSCSDYHWPEMLQAGQPVYTEFEIFSEAWLGNKKIKLIIKQINKINNKANK